MEWSSVEDGLPEVGVEVLVYIGMPAPPCGEVDISQLEEDGEWRRGRWTSTNVTHWAPLLETPGTAPRADFEAERLKRESDGFHRAMQLLRDLKRPHGRCEPRSRRACTHCNAKDDLDKMVSEYKGRPIRAW